jgi:hypothetical protein
LIKVLKNILTLIKSKNSLQFLVKNRKKLISL